MEKLPKWAELAQQKWKYTGEVRPPFAKEPGPGEESVWDYPRPPAIEPDIRPVTVKLGDLILAKSSDTIKIKETAGAPVFYIPKSDINMDLVEKSGRVTQCEWKGYGIHWHLKTAERLIENVGWSYEKPFPDYKRIEGYLSFYPAKAECYVGDERVQPQPGGFYGGWVTSEIVGPMKGEEDSASWW